MLIHNVLRGGFEDLPVLRESRRLVRLPNVREGHADCISHAYGVYMSKSRIRQKVYKFATHIGIARCRLKGDRQLTFIVLLFSDDDFLPDAS